MPESKRILLALQEAFFQPFPMKPFSNLFLFLIISFAHAGQARDSPGKTIRVLTVGNSFADNALTYLPQLAEAAGHTLITGKANLGGCTLERHWRHLAAHQMNPGDPEGSPYHNGKFSLDELLRKEKWDFVTIQQVSYRSHDPATYHPYAENLCTYIRERAPQARIMAHQIWAYRSDDPRFVPENEGMEPHTQAVMFQQVRRAYHSLADQFDLGIIPGGDAMFLADTHSRWGYQPDKTFDFDHAEVPDLPNQDHSLHRGWFWKKRDDGSKHLHIDGRHASDAGKYLLGCTWFETLFGDDVTPNLFVPRGLNPDYARFLRETAHQAVTDLRAESESARRPLSRILFGSCIRQDKPVPIFDAILEREADLFVFLGDNIYADTEDMNEMRAKYARLGSHPGFSRLADTCRLLATWDDHDYGVNDGGSEYREREAAQANFVDFWKAPATSPLRNRPGVYDSRVFGPKGQRVQVILLDTRYFRGPLKTGDRRTGGKYYPGEDPGVPMLGEDQWKWLGEQLGEPAELRIIASSIQVVPEAAGQETWSNLPHERQRLFDLIGETGANGVLIISGDRHWSEFSATSENTPYPIHDFTSSSLNQVHPRGTPTDNRYRVSETTYHLENFGEIEIEWARADTGIEVTILDMEGNAKMSQSIRLSELKASCPQ